MRSADRHVLRLAPVENERLRLAIFRSHPETAPNRVARAGSQPLALDEDLALLELVEAVDQPEQLRAAGADEPAETHDLTRVHLQADPANGGQPPGVSDLEQDTIRADRPVRVELIDLSPDHELDQLAGRRRRGETARRRAAVGQDGHAVADAPDLVETVRDVDDADALRGQTANDVEERADLGLVEDRRRLVHDEQPHVARERAGDRHDLLRRRPELPHLGAHGDRLVSEPSEQRSGVAVHLVEVEQRATARFVREEDALRDAQVRDEIELLVDRRHAALERSRGVSRRQRLAQEQDLAAGGLHRAGDTLDERRLACAVRAEQAVNLGLEHVEVDALERLDARVLLDQVANLEDLRHRTTSGRRLSRATWRPCSTSSGVPARIGSSCSTESTPSNPPS